ncbi:topoisomerase II [Artemisia annua]|uniref:DNA topoisomerase (ATP-hydrolyzing) n=1 Tax=Artemisia annua TaxID=35608 RepID=A0A2U1LH97_ARTAN|nr:topoisomerase II [Artemisia annua]
MITPNCHHDHHNQRQTALSLRLLARCGMEVSENEAKEGSEATEGGKDHADGDCIFTRLSPITRYLFPKDDELILHYLNDDGQSIEPKWFMPIIPMVLVNGSEGTGIGWSLFIPNYNPREIIANLKRLLRGEAMVAMHPWYKGFKGDIAQASKDIGYTTTGKMRVIEDGIRITELPVGRWTREYEEFLKAARYGQEHLIEAYTAHKDKTIVDFKIHMSEDQMNTANKEGGILKNFKLTTTLSTANMYLFDVGGAAIKKYDTPEQILQDFFPLRLDFYEKRRSYLLDELKKAILQLENKVRFMAEVLKGSIKTINREDDMIYADLDAKGFTYLSKETEPTPAGREKYGYLLSMPLASFSHKTIEQLKKEMDETTQFLGELKESTPVSLWLRDLEALDHQLVKYETLSLDEDESSPEIAEEAPEKKVPAKRAAAGPQGENKKKQRCD